MAVQKTSHNIIVTFGTSTTLTLYCRALTPPGLTLGDKKEITTLNTITAKAYIPGDLPERPDVTLMALLDPADEAKVLAALGVRQNIVFTYTQITTYGQNRGATETKTVYGWLNGWEPQEASVNGDPPEAQITLCFEGGKHDGSAANANW